MSRLDSFIRRMEAQRACLNAAAAAIADVPGPVLELGLGNGRTYDHLREILPDRAIWVFDRRVKAHPDCIPPEDRLFLGEVTETLPAAERALGARCAALIHTDLGTGDAAANAALAAEVGPLIARLMAPGGLVVANHELPGRPWDAVALPDGVKPGRYFLYRGREEAGEEAG
ncbi:MAG: class I SAM-dependent methyltransferase [Azospirillaceae bacterium]